MKQKDFYIKIESADQNIFCKSHTEDWGGTKGQGKRRGGMVMGGMADTGVRGVKRYLDPFYGLPDINSIRGDLSGLFGAGQIQYLKARASGFLHDIAMLASYAADGDLTETEAFNLALKFINEDDQND